MYENVFGIIGLLFSIGINIELCNCSEPKVDWKKYVSHDVANDFCQSKK